MLNFIQNRYSIKNIQRQAIEYMSNFNNTRTILYIENNLFKDNIDEYKIIPVDELNPDKFYISKFYYNDGIDLFYIAIPFEFKKKHAITLVEETVFINDLYALFDDEFLVSFLTDNLYTEYEKLTLKKIIMKIEISEIAKLKSSMITQRKNINDIISISKSHYGTEMFFSNNTEA